MKLFAIGFIIILLASACNNNTYQEPKAVSAENSEMRKIKLFSFQGEAIDLTRYKGKAIFLNFWATWCKPCVEEMPTIKNAIDSMKDKNIQFLFATDESAVEVEAFEKQHQFGFNYVKTSNIEQLGIVGLPTTFIFNKEGEKIFSEMRYRKWDEKDNLDILLKSTK